jgi:hypothetical protein
MAAAADQHVVQMLYPELADTGYYVYARFRGDDLLSPGSGLFYTEIETALAIGLGWVNNRWHIDSKTVSVSTRRFRRQVVALTIEFRNLPDVDVLVAREWYDPPPAEKPVRGNWWQSPRRR